MGYKMISILKVPKLNLQTVQIQVRQVFFVLYSLIFSFNFADINFLSAFYSALRFKG